MSENEIQILIRAVDEATEVLKNIEKEVKGTGKNIEKQTKATSKSFTKETDSLLALGNAASTVDNIFDSYQNLQLRLENAAERVAGAQDRLADAQYRLHQVQSDSGASAEDLANAQRNVESATRSLTIAQNNQERANNAVIGTYINMGMQGVTLAKSLPQLMTSISGLTSASLAFIATPIGATLAGITLALGAAKMATEAKKKAAEELVAANQRLDDSIRRVQDSQNALAAQPYSQAELKLQEAILEKQIQIGQLTEQRRLASEGQASPIEAGSIEKLQAEIEQLQLRQTLLQNAKQLVETKAQIEANSYAVMKAKNEEAIKSAQDEIILRAKAMTDTTKLIGNMGNVSINTMIGIDQASKATWSKMSTESAEAISSTITKLNEIPRDIYTYHHIITVYG